MLVNLVNAKKDAAASVTNCLKEVDADVNKVSAKVDATITLTNPVTMSISTELSPNEISALLRTTRERPFSSSGLVR